ncbi:hypothetical protein [Pseudonocardia alni]|uniref:hypothetical protein n=1 Tax=Pseudonocardia alni TaxID=33907 RepID=UPI001AD73226|nr:hypothetical protein [Pseudonocardia alni]MBO4237607.1 hypothetical protein [Pseudonocardia alni]
MYAVIDDGPYAGEQVRIDPDATGRPPRAIELSDPGGDPRGYVLIGPHADADRWIYRRARGDIDE